MSAPCGHELARELGWCFLSVTPCKLGLGGEHEEDRYTPTGVSKNGEDARFNATWNVHAKLIRMLLEDGAESVTLWRCSICNATWLWPEGRRA